MTDLDSPDANILERGPAPNQGRIPRWTLRADVPNRPLPPAVTYAVPRVSSLTIDGDIDTKPWAWSTPFLHMGTGDAVPHLTRCAFLWDDEYFYGAFDLVDPGRESLATVPGTHVYMFDTDAEILIAGPGGYYEVGVNSIGTTYELSWHWIQPMLDAGDAEQLDQMFRLPNFLYYAPQAGERVGRVGNLDFRLDGLVHAEKWADRHGEPGWTAEFALPWSSLGPVLGIEGPPASGDELRLQAYRAHHMESTPEEVAATAAQVGEGGSPWEGWTWSTQGNGNVHNLDRWATLTFTDEAADAL